MNDKKDFLERHKEHLDVLGFWDEDSRSSIIYCIESTYKKEIIREWGISDMVMNGDKILFKWYKRHEPLSEEELKKRFGHLK
jgi:hypothetical protein